MYAIRGDQKICRLDVNGTIVTGVGATEEAAREDVLKKVKEMVHHSPVVSPSEMMSTMNSAYFGSGRPTNANMVGRLQELCVAKHWPLPVYSFLDSRGPSHMPHFMMTCSVREFMAVGNGKTKKEAKHNAAQKLLDMIRGVGSPDRGSVPVGRVPPLCAPPVRHEVDLVYVEQRRFQSPNVQPTESFKGYCDSSPLYKGTLLAIKGKEVKERDLSPEREPISGSEVTECSGKPIPLPSVEDYLCGTFQDLGVN